MDEKVVIPVSKTKMIIVIIGCFAFVILCALMLKYDMSSNRYNPFLIKIAAIAGIIFFGIGGIVLLKKMFGTKRELIVDGEGIHDNFNGIGLIKWKEISGMSVYEVASTKMLLIYLHNAEAFIESKVGSGIKAKLMRSNNKMYGTPISISSVTLKYKFNDLKELIAEFYEKYK